MENHSTVLQALGLVEKETMLLPFATLIGYIHILGQRRRHYTPSKLQSSLVWDGLCECRRLGFDHNLALLDHLAEPYPRYDRGDF
jgi:hypothetical protein